MDNGPEFISLALAEWAEIHVEFIQSGKPTQNAFIERFNRAYCTEILVLVREITEKRLSEYNCERPHESLNNMTPEEYRLHHYLVRFSKVHGTKTGLFTMSPSFESSDRCGETVAHLVRDRHLNLATTILMRTIYLMLNLEMCLKRSMSYIILCLHIH